MGDGSRITGIFLPVGFVALAVGLGISAYPVTVVRRRAIKADDDPRRPALRSLSRENDEER